MKQEEFSDFSSFCFEYRSVGNRMSSSTNMASAEAVVQTKVGKVRGRLDDSVTGDKFFWFRGIPYAQPPVGELRFQDPKPVEPWSGIRDAFTYGSVCAQENPLTFQLTGSDDCLYLNVHTHNIDASAKKPVMVWIHGGAFICGQGDDSLYGPDYFMRRDIVFVSINYRLGVLGFLNLEDEIAPGNQGLKDQVVALQWVRDNIVNFGGDPDNVTIFGESAGAASVHYLCISPLAKGLFSKAIMQSGAVYNTWAYSTDNPKSIAHRLCEQLGKKITDSKEIVDFLRTVDVLKLAEAQREIAKQVKHLFIFPFGPGVDAKSKSPFMPTHPTIAAKVGVQVPLLVGHTSREGIILLTDIIPKLNEFNSNFDKSLNANVKNALNYYNLSFDKLKRLYLKSDEVTINNLEPLIDLLGDMYFVEGIHRLLTVQVKKSSSSTYFYQYSPEKTESIIKSLLKKNNVPGYDIPGRSHADELKMIFHPKILEKMSEEPLKKGSLEYKVMEQMTDMWVNFATYGRPTPITSSISESEQVCWKPVCNDKILRYLNICEEVHMDVTVNLEERYTI